MTVSPGVEGRSFPGATAALAGLLFFGVLTLWVRERWAAGVLQAGICLLGMAGCWWWARGRFAIGRCWVLFPFAGAALWGLLQLAVGSTVYRFDTWNGVLFWTSAAVLVAVAAAATGGAEARHRLLRALLYFGFVVSVLATTQYFTSEGDVFWLFPSGYPDALGPFVYRNNYAAFIELLLPVALAEALRDRRRATAFALMASVMYASVVASASRAGSILATLEILAVLTLAHRRGFVSLRRLGLAMAKIGVLAALFVGVVGWRALTERLAMADPFVHRREMLQSTLAMARERPWLGFGLGTFQEAYPAYATFDIGLAVNHAHNDWAEWLAEGGVPLLAMLGSVAVWAVLPAVRSLWGIGLISVFAHALVDYPMQRLGMAAWIFVFLGLLAAEERDRRRQAAIP
ncbi:MAG TPA: O-antigen ligase family protein [Bryobacteraceae bacterium]|nr:O-antigen ligase family protein [Bryobacteraceae bacterium]